MIKSEKVVILTTENSRLPNFVTASFINMFITF